MQRSQPSSKCRQQSTQAIKKPTRGKCKGSYALWKLGLEHKDILVKGFAGDEAIAFDLRLAACSCPGGKLTTVIEEYASQTLRHQLD